MQPRLALNLMCRLTLNSCFSCLYLPSAEVTVGCHCSIFCDKNWTQGFIHKGERATNSTTSLVQAILGPLHLHIGFKISLSISSQKAARILVGIAILINLGKLMLNLILTLLIYNHEIPSTYAFSFPQWSCCFHFFLQFLCSMFAYVWAHMCIGMYTCMGAGGCCVGIHVYWYAYMRAGGWCVGIHMYCYVYMFDSWRLMCGYTHVLLCIHAWELEVDVWAHMCIVMYAWELEVDVRNQFWSLFHLI